MKKRSFWGIAFCAFMTFALCASTVTTPVGAVITNKNKNSNQSSSSSSGSKTTTKSKTTTDSGDTVNVEAEVNADGTENVKVSGNVGGTEVDVTTTTDGQTVDVDAGTKSSSGSTKTTTSKSTTKSSASSKSSTPKIDAKGNTILLTDTQRRNKWRSKTNPKRDIKPAPKAYRPNQNGFTYADFGVCNSYNSENGLGGNYVYLLGTITDIEKVYENTLYYGVAVLVNDCDGYQWYMRVEIAKAKYDMFKGNFLGKSGYIYGIYSGYSGVTDRPMMDIRVIFPTGEYMIDMKYYQ